MEKTIAQKLDALLKLQSIDSEIDDIKKVRGSLPDDVQDLEDEVARLQTRMSKFEETVKEIDKNIAGYKIAKKDAEKLAEKYKKQQDNVKNNREFEALSKEIESEELEMQLMDKRTREGKDQTEGKKREMEILKEELDDRKKDLAAKKKELANILTESEEDEAKLNKDREKQAKNIEERLLISYDKIRKNANNGLGVVMVKREACGGCFNIVPPQRQADIRNKKKITVCEHCGRILAGVEDIVIKEEEKVVRKRATPTRIVAAK